MSEIRSRQDRTVVVIAPEDVTVRVSAGAQVVRFASSAAVAQGSIRADRIAVHLALAELRIDLSACSARTQEVVARLCDRETIPSVKELLADCSSRRSFYRSWHLDIPETPAAFIERVRLLHLHAAQRGTSVS